VRKFFGSFAVVVMLILAVGVFTTADASDDVAPEVSAQVDMVAEGDITEEVKEYVEDFVEKKEGVSSSDISNIKEVDFNKLPKEVNIENVGDTNLAIYEIEYTEPGEQVQDKVFVVTYAVEKLRAQGDLIIAHDKRQFLNFGFDGEMKESGFLKSATGVEGSLEKGYVMMREGSITGISTSLDVSKTGDEDIEIVIYINGNSVNFGNALSGDLDGAKKDYDVQSNGVVTFEPGDVISVYAKADGKLVWEDVITMIEITTTN